MKRFVIWKLVFAVAAVAFMATGVAARQSSSTRYFVVYKSGRVPANAAARIAAAGGRGQRALHEIGAVSAWGDANFAAIVAADRDVLAVGPQRIHARPSAQFTEHASETAAAPLPADNLYFFQWNLRRIGAPAVWAQFPLPTDGRRPTVAVLDTGVADNHPDLAGQIVSSKATSFCNTPGGPGNTAGYPIYATLIDFDAHDPWEPADGCTAAAPRFEGHGTHVAGTVAARFGGSRVVGVAPDAAIAVYKVFDRYRVTLTPPGEEEEETIDDIGAFDEPVFLAIIDAVNSGIPVINMSLGGLILRSNQSDNAAWHAWDRVMKYANRAGTVIVAAAGNEEFNLNGPVAAIPADLSPVISVSATGVSQLAQDRNGIFVVPPDAHDVLAFYSNYGAAVDVAAPGGDCGPNYPATCPSQYLILSTYIDPAGALGFAFSAGTSMAAPHVAAVAAQVKALHPTWTPGRVRAHIKSTADDIGSRQQFGAGMLNAAAAVR